MVGLDNPLHILIVLVVILLVFGAKRLPEMGKSMGAGLRGFKNSLNGETPEEPTVPAQQLTQASDEPVAQPADTAAVSDSAAADASPAERRPAAPVA